MILIRKELKRQTHRDSLYKQKTKHYFKQNKQLIIFLAAIHLPTSIEQSSDKI